MNRIGFYVAGALIVLMILFSTLFVVDQRQFAVVYALGEIKEVVTEPGLKFKLPPPFQNVVFLDRRIQTLDSPALGWLTQAFERTGRFSLNLMARGVALVLRGVARLTGRGFLERLAEFVAELNQLFGGFRERAIRVAKAFRSPDFAQGKDRSS